MNVEPMKTPKEYEGRTYERRWWTLGVLCISLVMIVVANASLNVALPTLVRRPARFGQLAAMDRRRLQPRVRGPAADGRVRSATVTDGGSRSTAGSSSSASHRDSPRSRTRRASSSPRARSWASAPRSSCRPHCRFWRTCSRPRSARQAIAIWAGFAGVGAALGGVISGWLLEHFWWGSIFLTNVVVVGSRARSPARSSSRRRTKTRSPRSTSSARCFRSPDSARSSTRSSRRRHAVGCRARRSPRSRSRPWFSCVLARWELHIPEPMLDLRFFRNPQFAAAAGIDHVRVLRDVRHDLRADAVPTTRARLQPARSRCAHAALGGRVHALGTPIGALRGALRPTRRRVVGIWWSWPPVLRSWR